MSICSAQFFVVHIFLWTCEIVKKQMKKFVQNIKADELPPSLMAVATSTEVLLMAVAALTEVFLTAVAAVTVASLVAVAALATDDSISLDRTVVMGF